MSYSTKNNRRLTASFDTVFPSAHSTNALPTDIRIFQARAAGARLWDVDDNEYIDYTSALGPNILGHRHPEYIQALESHISTKSICTGASYIYSEDDVALAEKLIRHVPCAEQVKLCVSGSEAVQQAIRLARAYTGRPYFLKFGGHYHGWIDNIYGGQPNTSENQKPFPVFDANHRRGMSSGSEKEGLMIPWNDIAKLEHTLELYGHEIAIIIMEAASGGAVVPFEGFLQQVRQLSDKHGIVMCFDEVITGFRMGLNGAQGSFGITPDLCTLGKALGGGMPISAVAGKSEILGQFTDAKVKGPGTFNGNPLCVTAALATIGIVEQGDGVAYSTMAKTQRALMSGLDEIARRRGIPVRVQGPTGAFLTCFGVDPDKALHTETDLAAVDMTMTKRFYHDMLRAGVITLCGRWFPSIVHTDKETEQTLQAFDSVLSHW